MAYYANDAQSMGPNAPTLVGAEAIRADTEKDMAEGGEGYTAKMEVKDVWAAGDIAVETGAYTVTGPDGEVVNRGKFMSLFEKRDGKYICIRDIYNSDMEKKSEDAHDHEHDQVFSHDQGKRP